MSASRHCRVALSPSPLLALLQHITATDVIINGLRVRVTMLASSRPFFSADPEQEVVVVVVVVVGSS